MAYRHFTDSTTARLFESCAMDNLLLPSAKAKADSHASVSTGMMRKRALKLAQAA